MGRVDTNVLTSVVQFLLKCDRLSEGITVDVAHGKYYVSMYVGRDL